MKEDDETILVVDSDSEEDERIVWQSKSKNKQFQLLWQKIKPLLFHHVLPEYKSTYFPYEQFKELSDDLRQSLKLVHVKSTQSFIWKNVIRWLASLKLCCEGISDLRYDEKYNLILTDYMAQYINYKCQIYSTITDETELCRKVDEIVGTLGVVFSGYIPGILMTLLKINVKDEYRLILDPIFRKYLSNRELHEPNELISYLRLILCYRKWKKLTHFKDDKEEINEIAVGKSEKNLRSADCVDLTDKEAVLPKLVPPVTPNNRSFLGISGLIKVAIKNKSYGTRVLLINKSLDLDETIERYFKQYDEKYINRIEATLCESTKTLGIFENAWDFSGCLSPVPQPMVVQELKLSPSRRESEEETFSPETESEQQASSSSTRGTKAVSQHLSLDCDIFNLSKQFNHSELSSNSKSLSQKSQTSYSGVNISPKNKNNKTGFVVELIDDTDDEAGHDDNTVINSNSKIATTKPVNDDDKPTIDTVSDEKQTNKTPNPLQMQALYIEKLQERAELLSVHSHLSNNSNQVTTRRTSTVVLLSSSDEDEEPVSAAPERHATGSHINVARRDLNQNSDSLHRQGADRPSKKEKIRCITGVVSSTTESYAASNVGTEVGTLSEVRTSRILAGTDCSDISDDDAGPSRIGGSRPVSGVYSSKFSKVVEEATSSTSEIQIPLRASISEALSENVIFSINPHRSRNSTYNSPCPTRSTSPAGNCANILPSSTITSASRSNESRQSSDRVSALSLDSNVDPSSEDCEVATCSRYVVRTSPRMIRFSNKRFEVCQSTDAGEKKCSRKSEARSASKATNVAPEDHQYSLSAENKHNSDLNKFLNDISDHIGESEGKLSVSIEPSKFEKIVSEPAKARTLAVKLTKCVVVLHEVQPGTSKCDPKNPNSKPESCNIKPIQGAADLHDVKADKLKSKVGTSDFLAPQESATEDLISEPLNNSKATESSINFHEVHADETQPKEAVTPKSPSNLALAKGGVVAVSKINSNKNQLKGPKLKPLSLNSNENVLFESSNNSGLTKSLSQEATSKVQSSNSKPFESPVNSNEVKTIQSASKLRTLKSSTSAKEGIGVSKSLQPLESKHHGEEPKKQHLHLSKLHMIRDSKLAAIVTHTDLKAQDNRSVNEKESKSALLEPPTDEINTLEPPTETAKPNKGNEVELYGETAKNQIESSSDDPEDDLSSPLLEEELSVDEDDIESPAFEPIGTSTSEDSFVTGGQTVELTTPHRRSIEGQIPHSNSMDQILENNITTDAFSGIMRFKRPERTVFVDEVCKNESEYPSNADESLVDNSNKSMDHNQGTEIQIAPNSTSEDRIFRNFIIEHKACNDENPKDLTTDKESNYDHNSSVEEKSDETVENPINDLSAFKDQDNIEDNYTNKQSVDQISPAYRSEHKEHQCDPLVENVDNFARHDHYDRGKLIVGNQITTSADEDEEERSPHDVSKGQFEISEEQLPVDEKNVSEGKSDIDECDLVGKFSEDRSVLNEEQSDAKSDIIDQCDLVGKFSEDRSVLNKEQSDGKSDIIDECDFVGKFSEDRSVLNEEQSELASDELIVEKQAPTSADYSSVIDTGDHRSVENQHHGADQCFSNDENRATDGASNEVKAATKKACEDEINLNNNASKDQSLKDEFDSAMSSEDVDKTCKHQGSNCHISNNTSKENLALEDRVCSKTSEHHSSFQATATDTANKNADQRLLSTSVVGTKKTLLSMIEAEKMNNEKNVRTAKVIPAKKELKKSNRKLKVRIAISAELEKILRMKKVLSSTNTDGETDKLNETLPATDVNEVEETSTVVVENKTETLPVDTQSTYNVGSEANSKESDAQQLQKKVSVSLELEVLPPAVSDVEGMSKPAAELQIEERSALEELSECESTVDKSGPTITCPVELNEREKLEKKSTEAVPVQVACISDNKEISKAEGKFIARPESDEVSQSAVNIVNVEPTLTKLDVLANTHDDFAKDKVPECLAGESPLVESKIVEKKLPDSIAEVAPALGSKKLSQTDSNPEVAADKEEAEYSSKKGDPSPELIDTIREKAASHEEVCSISVQNIITELPANEEITENETSSLTIDAKNITLAVLSCDKTNASVDIVAIPCSVFERLDTSAEDKLVSDSSQKESNQLSCICESAEIVCPKPITPQSEMQEQFRTLQSNEFNLEQKSHTFSKNSAFKTKSKASVLNSWPNETEQRIVQNLRRTEGDPPEEDSNLSTQVQVTSEDLGDPASSFDCGTGENSPAYQHNAFETVDYDQSQSATVAVASSCPTEDQEVSTITSQADKNLMYNTYHDDCGTPVLDEKDAEEVESPTSQGKIVSLSILKEIPSEPVMLQTFSQQIALNVNARIPKSLSKSAGSSVSFSPNHFASRASTDSQEISDATIPNVSTASAASKSNFLLPSPKLKPSMDTGSGPVKLRLKRRISQCADINEEFNLGPSEPKKTKLDQPISDIVQSVPLPSNNVPLNLVMRSDKQYLSQPIPQFCNVALSLEEEDQNILYQKSWFKKLGISKTNHKALHMEQHSPSPKYQELRKTTKEEEVSTHSTETQLVVKNEGRRRKPNRVKKLTEKSHEVTVPPQVTLCDPLASAVTFQSQLLEATYNPEDIKAATILSDMLKKSSKIDDTPSIDFEKSIRSRKGSKKAAKNSPMQCTRFTRSTSQLMDKSSDTPIIPTGVPSSHTAAKKQTKETKGSTFKKNAISSSNESIWQQEKTQEILRSFTTVADTIQQPTVALRKSSSFSHCSSDSDDIGRLVIDLESKSSTASKQSNKTKGMKNCKRKSPGKKIALEKKVTELLKNANRKAEMGIEICPPAVNYDESLLLSANSIFKLTSEVDVYFPGALRPEPPQTTENYETLTISPTKRTVSQRKSSDDEVSRFYPIVQLTEDVPFTPKSRANRGRKQTQARTRGRAVARRLLEQETVILPTDEAKSRSKSVGKRKTGDAKHVSCPKKDAPGPATGSGTKQKSRPKRLSFGIDTILGNRVDSPPSVQDELTKDKLDLNDSTSPQLTMNKEMYLTNFSLRKTPKSIDAVVKKLSESKPDIIAHSQSPCDSTPKNRKLSTGRARRGKSIHPRRLRNHRKSLIMAKTKSPSRTADSDLKTAATSEVDVLKIKEELRQLQPIRNRRKSLRSTVKILNAEPNENSEDNEPIQNGNHIENSEMASVDSEPLELAKSDGTSKANVGQSEEAPETKAAVNTAGSAIQCPETAQSVEHTQQQFKKDKTVTTEKATEDDTVTAQNLTIPNDIQKQSKGTCESETQPLVVQNSEIAEEMAHTLKETQSPAVESKSVEKLRPCDTIDSKAVNTKTGEDATREEQHQEISKPQSIPQEIVKHLDKPSKDTRKSKKVSKSKARKQKKSHRHAEVGKAPEKDQDETFDSEATTNKAESAKETFTPPVETQPQLGEIQESKAGRKQIKSTKDTLKGIDDATQNAEKTVDGNKQQVEKQTKKAKKSASRKQKKSAAKVVKPLVELQQLAVETEALVKKEDALNRINVTTTNDIQGQSEETSAKAARKHLENSADKGQPNLQSTPVSKEHPSTVETLDHEFKTPLAETDTKSSNTYTPPSDVEVERITKRRQSIGDQCAVAELKPNNKLHEKTAKPELVMRVRRLSIDETNVKMTIQRCPEVPEKSNHISHRHTKKAKKNQRRQSVEKSTDMTGWTMAREQESTPVEDRDCQTDNDLEKTTDAIRIAAPVESTQPHERLKEKDSVATLHSTLLEDPMEESTAIAKAAQDSKKLESEMCAEEPSVPDTFVSVSEVSEVHEVSVDSSAKIDHVSTVEESKEKARKIDSLAEKEAKIREDDTPEISEVEPIPELNDKAPLIAKGIGDRETLSEAAKPTSVNKQILDPDLATSKRKRSLPMEPVDTRDQRITRSAERTVPVNVETETAHISQEKTTGENYHIVDQLSIEVTPHDSNRKEIALDDANSMNSTVSRTKRKSKKEYPKVARIAELLELCVPPPVEVVDKSLELPFKQTDFPQPSEIDSDKTTPSIDEPVKTSLKSLFETESKSPRTARKRLSLDGDSDSRNLRTSLLARSHSLSEVDFMNAPFRNVQLTKEIHLHSQEISKQIAEPEEALPKSLFASYSTKSPCKRERHSLDGERSSKNPPTALRTRSHSLELNGAKVADVPFKKLETIQPNYSVSEGSTAVSEREKVSIPALFATDLTKSQSKRERLSLDGGQISTKKSSLRRRSLSLELHQMKLAKPGTKILHPAVEPKKALIEALFPDDSTKSSCKRKRLSLDGAAQFSDSSTVLRTRRHSLQLTTTPEHVNEGKSLLTTSSTKSQSNSVADNNLELSAVTCTKEPNIVKAEATRVEERHTSAKALPVFDPQSKRKRLSLDDSRSFLTSPITPRTRTRSLGLHQIIDALSKSAHATESKGINTEVVSTNIDPSKRAFNINLFANESIKPQHPRKRLSLDFDQSFVSSPTSLSTRLSHSCELFELPLKKICLNEPCQTIPEEDLTHIDETSTECPEEPTEIKIETKPDVAEQLDLSINNIFGNQLSETESNDSSAAMSKILLINRPQGFDRVPDDIFAGNGDTSDNTDTKFYPMLFQPKDLMLKTSPSEDSQQGDESELEGEPLKLDTGNDNDDEENPYEKKPDAESLVNDSHSGGNSFIPDINAFANKSPMFKETDILYDFNDHTDFTDVLDKMVNDMQPLLPSDCMQERNTRKDIDDIPPGFLSQPLLIIEPDDEGMEAVSPFDVERNISKRNVFVDSFASSKSEESHEIEDDFENDILSYSYLMSIPTEYNSCGKSQRLCVTSTPVKLIDSPSKIVDSKSGLNDDSLFKRPSSVPVSEVAPVQSAVNYNAPVVEVTTEIGFDSYDELSADNSHFFPSFGLEKSRKRSRSGSENETDLENEEIPPSAIRHAPVADVLEDDLVTVKCKPNENKSCPVENSTPPTQPSTEKEPTECDTKNSDKEQPKPSATVTNEPKVKKAKLLRNLTPAKQVNITYSSVKLKSHPLPYWKNKSDKPQPQHQPSDVETANKTVLKVPESTRDIASNRSEVKMQSATEVVIQPPPAPITESVMTTASKSLPIIFDGIEDIQPKVSLTKLPDLDDCLENKHELASTASAAGPPSKKPRIEPVPTLSTDDLFDRLKQEPPVNLVMRKSKTIIKQASFETDDNSSMDSAVGLLTARASDVIVADATSTPATALPPPSAVAIPSMPIISTPSRVEISEPIIVETLDAITMPMAENPVTLASSKADTTDKPLVLHAPTKRSSIDENKVQMAPPPKPVTAESSEKLSTPATSALNSSTVKSAFTSPLPPAKPLISVPAAACPSKSEVKCAKVSFSSSVTDIPDKCIVRRSRSDPPQFPAQTHKPLKSILLTTSKIRVASPPVAKPKSSKKQLSDTSSPLQCQIATEPLPNPKTVTPTLAAPAVVPFTSRRTPSTPSSNLTPSGKSTVQARPNPFAIATPSPRSTPSTPSARSMPSTPCARSTTSARSTPSPSAMLTSLDAKIISVTDALNKLPKNDATYLLYRERKELVQKLKHLEDLKKQHQQEDARQHYAHHSKSRSQSHSEHHPLHSYSMNHRHKETSSQRELKDRHETRSSRYVNKFGELRNKGSDLSHKSGNKPSRESKTLPSWDPKPASAEEIIADLKKKTSRRN